ncbi:hypothetical protein SL034_004322 [Vibrio harveyi]|uniref:hypothetical protein n=1 Tax=Vibrio harveyi group TaxID=717610 RepID=UPI0009718EA1|nr:MULTISPECIES: hypothetical protein [Vibrio harveyi group]ELY1989234.1 hypothetical protein [Vibrio harveyi]APX10066.1 hypothetical protein BWP24_28160 [Vibrio campbellii]ARR10532.1 hypothetical protein Vc3S01_p40046 [Vibrio campbellii]WCP78940.1 hypothetical protein PPW95_25360 [Vibrio parahaemolyticus]WHP52973.1 hypothetical protein QMY43_24955 [Vibrio parahaemolyticus]
MTLIAKLQNHTKACNARFSAMQERIHNAYEAQNGEAPNVDDNGQFHAPYDGYEGVNGGLYAKGQFIPNPFETDEETFYGRSFSSFTYESRKQVAGDFLKEVRELAENDLDGVKLSFGKEFDKQGTKTAYVYIKAHSKGYFNIVIAFLESGIEQQKEVIEAAKPVKGIAPTGKQMIKGVVLGLPVYEGYYGAEYKMMIELENHSTVFGSLPKSLYDAKIGDSVEFSATFEHSPEDDTHAFFKRPTKAKVL